MRGQPRTILCQRVEHGGVNPRIAIATQIAPAEVIGEDEEDVRFCGGRLAAKKRKEGTDDGENFVSHGVVASFMPVGASERGRERR